MFVRRALQRADTTLLSSRQALSRPARLYTTPSKRANAPAALATAPVPPEAVFDAHLYHPNPTYAASSVLEGFLNQPKSYTFLPSLRPHDSDSSVNQEWYGDSETQDLMAIMDACLHNLYDVERAMGIFQGLRERGDKRSALEPRVYNAFLEAYATMAKEKEPQNAQMWLELFWSLFESMQAGSEGVSPTATTYALALQTSHRTPRELSSMALYDHKDLLSFIISRGLELKHIVADRIFTDSEEAAIIIQTLSRAAIQLGLPDIVATLGQTEAMGAAQNPDILDNIPEVMPVLKRVVHKSADGLADEERDEIPFNLENLRKHLAQVNFARRLIPDDATARQKLLEESVYDVAVERMKHETDALTKLGLNNGFKRDLRSWMWEWHTKLTARLEEEIHKIEVAESTKRSRRSQLAQYLVLVRPDRLSLLTILEVMTLQGSGGVAKGLKTTRVLVAVGRAVEMEYKAQMCRRNNIALPSLKHTVEPGYFSSLGYKSLLERRIAAAKHVSDNESWTSNWTQVTRTQIGGLLIDALMGVAKVVRTATDKQGSVVSEEQPAFYHGYEYNRGHKVGTIRVNEEIANAMQKDSLAGTIHPRHLPMLVPPRPWVAPDSGGYYYNKTHAMRYKESIEQASYMRHASAMGNVELIYAGLDVLGATPWQINQKIFEVVLEVWNSGQGLGKLPPATYPVPEPVLPPNASAKDKATYMSKMKYWHQEKGNNHSKRCSVNYKIEIARSLLGDKIYQPHNLDFRGRAYPIPPHLNHIGDDLSRGLLKFAEAKPLGERGLRWLKIHIANLYGYDKANFDERVQFVDDRLDEVFDCAEKPLTGRGWWKHADDPWQCLATCFELHGALTSPDPYAYLSSQPIHQDGTCNGLQHYAALGGDSRGAQQVNLAAGDRPSDVYTYVANMVESVIANDVAKGDPAATILQNKISRKMVKQTVMTTVYGVTYVGARDQIERQIKAIEHFKHEDAWQLSAYMAKNVLSCIGDLFTGAQGIMNWLTISARLISRAIPNERLPEALKEYNDKQGVNIQHLPLDRLKREQLTSVVWTTPLGLPIVQPYRKTKRKQVMTKVQTVYISDPNVLNEVNALKQASAFPPNFIHSLDATHMMLSALECQTQGLTFAAVHDSYWTHASSIDQMSVIIRDTFIALHSSDVLGKLRAEFIERYKDYKIPLVYLKSPSLLKALKVAGVKLNVTKKQSQDMPGLDGITDVKADDSCLTEAKTTIEEQEALLESMERLVEDEDLEEEEDSSDADDMESDEFQDEDAVPKKRAAPKIKKVVNETDSKLLGKFVDLTAILPPVPQKGDFRVEAIKASQYFFS